jgi:hypothetical protein
MATLAEVIAQADKVRRGKERKDELQAQKQALQSQVADINGKLDVVNASLAADVAKLKALCADLT